MYTKKKLSAFLIDSIVYSVLSSSFVAPRMSLCLSNSAPTYYNFLSAHAVLAIVIVAYAPQQVHPRFDSFLLKLSFKISNQTSS